MLSVKTIAMAMASKGSLELGPEDPEDCVNENVKVCFLPSDTGF